MLSHVVCYTVPSHSGSSRLLGMLDHDVQNVVKYLPLKTARYRSKFKFALFE